MRSPLQKGQVKGPAQISDTHVVNTVYLQMIDRGAVTVNS